MNPLAIAVQGLGFGAAMAALQGLLYFVAVEVQKAEAAGGGLKTRRRVQVASTWIPDVAATEDEDVLLLIGVI